jgi:hypothetical protein
VAATTTKKRPRQTDPAASESLTGEFTLQRSKAMANLAAVGVAIEHASTTHAV